MCMTKTESPHGGFARRSDWNWRVIYCTMTHHNCVKSKKKTNFIVSNARVELLKLSKCSVQKYVNFYDKTKLSMFSLTETGWVRLMVTPYYDNLIRIWRMIRSIYVKHLKRVDTTAVNNGNSCFPNRNTIYNLSKTSFCPHGAFSPEGINTVILVIPRKFSH